MSILGNSLAGGLNVVPHSYAASKLSFMRRIDDAVTSVGEEFFVKVTFSAGIGSPLIDQVMTALMVSSL